VSRARGYLTEALVVRTIPFGETSQVVHLTTPEHGLVAALAKGAHRRGGEFQGGIPLGALGEAALAPRRPGEMELMRSFRSTADLRGLGHDLTRYYAASYVLELVREWMRPALANPTLHRAAATALRLLAASDEASVPAWVVWFEARAVAATGHRPRLDACAACGRPATGETVFAPGAGGLAHGSCATFGPRRRLTAPALEGLRRLYSTRITELVAEPLTPFSVREARAVHDLLVPYVLERRPDALATLPRP
jgi:DNA repair protein RecO (recombination protein O)